MNVVPRTLAAFILAALNASAATHYVSLGSTNPMPPYTNWATAATNIQQAVNAASAGEEVVVTNGIYAGGVIVTNSLALRSVNGPQLTVIDGGGTNQCISLARNASLSGVMLTKGYFNGSGGGCEAYLFTNGFSAILTNCTLSGNSAYTGGGASGCALYNCTLTGNAAFGAGYLGHGGGASGCTLYNCTLSSNSAYTGGGASGCTLYNCTLTGNSVLSDSYHMGGGGAESSTLYNCSLSGNSASGNFSEGGGVLNSTLYNCTLTANSAYYAGGGSSGGYLYNCTLTGNSAEYGGGSSGDFLLNSIVYFNMAPYGANYDTSYINLYIYSSCTAPMPPVEAGNVTNAPVFVDYAGGNLRLQSNSPCINAGNNVYVYRTTDLDGRPRIVGGTVDMGAYEFQPGISGAFIGWLQQYGLPTDGSADYIDSDVDGMNNWQKWICGTDPTNAASVLKMLSPAGGASRTDVRWLSVTNRNYFLQRAPNLALQASFLTVATNVAGQVGITTFTDTNAAGGGPFFYRVGVKHP